MYSQTVNAWLLCPCLFVPPSDVVHLKFYRSSIFCHTIIECAYSNVFVFALKHLWSLLNVSICWNLFTHRNTLEPLRLLFVKYRLLEIFLQPQVPIFLYCKGRDWLSV